MNPRYLLIVAFSGLASCTYMDKYDSSIIASLEDRTPEIDRRTSVDDGKRKAISGYQEFLKTAPDHEFRPEAMRRLGDLQMETAEEHELAASDGLATGEQDKTTASPSQAVPTDYHQAIQWYQDLLRVYPNYPANDRVLYQLAKAYEQSGDLQQSLRVLNRLVETYPDTIYRDEVQFRRGELLFSLQSYAMSQQAYESIIQQGDTSPYYQRAMYMHGWSLFKQQHYDEALKSFFSVLDRRLIGRATGPSLSEMSMLTRAERELIEDTMRVVSLSLSNLNGAESIPAYFTDEKRSEYEFLVYRELGDLYFKQERIKDAADTYSGFGRRFPTHPQAPTMQAKVIEAYEQAGFASLALNAKKDFTTRFGINSEYRRASRDEVYLRVLPLLKTNLEDLARHYHASAQKTKAVGDYEVAARWYREFLEAFPSDPQAPGMNFLLAEMLFESHQFVPAVVEYEKTAYLYPRHDKSADAGYAALLAHVEQEKRLGAKDNKREWQERAIDSALRFADANAIDPRTPAVLTQTAEKLYVLHDPRRAARIARRVLALKPQTAPALRRTAWTVLAHTEFEKGAFDRAETGYQQALTLTSEKQKDRKVLVERLAAAVYKQGEQLRSAGKWTEAAAHFLRVGQVAPDSPIRANADFDAASAYIAMKNWPAATKTLEKFRRTYPDHPLQAEISGKLAVVYLEQGQWSPAAVEFETLASEKNRDISVRREALWQAAELHEKADNDQRAYAAYKQYIEQFARPIEPAIEARDRLAKLSVKNGQSKAQHGWLAQLVKAERGAGQERTDRTRFLAAHAAMTLAKPYYDDYRRARLVEPLKKSLKIKKQKMQRVLKAYGEAADYGVAEVATAATFHIAEIYSDLGRALLTSQRPKNLSADELEQYVVLLEEQAFPFEEKAIELHEVNIRRIADGIYDPWVKRSIAALGKLRPVRYAKVEKSEVIINALR